MQLDYDLHDAIGYQLSLTARHVEQRFEPALHALGLTRTTWCVALATEGAGLRHPSEIAAYIGLDRTAISRALRQMERDGLIIRSQGEADGRTRQVQLTPAGRDCLAAANQAANRARHDTEARLSKSELETLKSLLQKLRKGDEEMLTRL